MFEPKNYLKRSQDFENSYHDSGQFFWIKVDRSSENKNIYSTKCYPLILNELEVQDIDNEEDWKLAKLKYQILKENEKLS